MTSPVEELREAAKQLRELAGKATPGPWRLIRDGQDLVMQSPIEGDDVAAWTYGVRRGHDEDWAECDTRDAEYIASMHPGVALALADWLDKDDLYCWGPAEKAHALAIARAVLGTGGEQR